MTFRELHQFVVDHPNHEALNEQVGLEAERDALKAKVVELERYTEDIGEGQDRAEGDAWELTADVVALRDLLRAIWPVYRAAVTLIAARCGPDAFDVVDDAVATARSALTPDLLAAAERAGLECG